MNLSTESFAQVSPPRPGGGVVRGVNLSFLQDAMPAKKPVHSIRRIFRIGVISSKFLSMNLFSFIGLLSWIQLQAGIYGFRRQLQYPSFVIVRNGIDRH